MASPSDLSLDYKPTNYSSAVQKGNNDQLEQTQKLQEFLARLEEERLKIEAFKRELPLCMQLLTNAVEAYRQQLEACRSSQGAKPVLEEFIPIKQIGIEENEKESNNPQSEKSSWMVSAQLWNPSSHEAKPQIQVKENDNNSFEVSPKVLLDAKQRNGAGGAFLPFSKEKNKMNDSNSRDLPELALAPIEKENHDEKKPTDQMECNGGVSLRKENGDQQGKKAADGSASAPQAHRKARRCWSPDLHRRFVNALQILGGAQVATPKQIRELMKVDGLTNDEVKSHLQKYRLHTRRPIPAPQPPSGPATQLVVLGGIWVPPEYATSAGAPAIYGAHPGPGPHYCSAAPMRPQEFYAQQTTAMAVPPVHQHHLRTGVNTVSVAGYKNCTGSPEVEVRSGGDRSESIEEEGEERDEDEEDDVTAVPDTNGTGGAEVELKF